MKLLKAVSRLCENKELLITSKEYDNILCGRVVKEHSFVNNDLPIQPKESKWEEVENPLGEGNVIIRIFEFVNSKTFNYFISEMLSYQEKMNHHARIIINYYEVEVQLQTKDINDITALDLDMSEFLDEVYKDTQFFYTVK